MRLLLLLLTVALTSCAQSKPDQPIEQGTVAWLTDHDQALAQSEKTGKPVFILFQEVPG